MRVRDIMQREVVTVGPEASVRDLVKLLSLRGITGMPVVEEDGRTVGVVSATDVLRCAATPVETAAAEPSLGGGSAARNGEEQEVAPLAYFLGLDSECRQERLDLAKVAEPGFEEVRVRDIMTPAIFRVRGEATVTELARFLTMAGVHRALVIERGRLAGVVSAMDVVRAVAQSGEPAPAFRPAASR